MRFDSAARRVVAHFMLMTMAIPASFVQPTLAQGPRRPPPGFRPPPRPPVVVNNYSNNGAGLAAGALGFGFGMLAGAATAPRPATNTVVVTPPASSVVVTRPSAPVMVAPSQPSVIVSQPPVVISRPVATDNVAEALKMLNGRSWKTRRDGATMLGRSRSQTAVGPLMDKLRNDNKDEVRKAAAWALAEIGDASALDYLEKTVQFDESTEVRAAARTAQQRLLTRIAMASPATTRSAAIAIEPARPATSPALPPPAPTPGGSVPTSGEKNRSSLPRSGMPGVSKPAGGSGRVPSFEAAKPSAKSPFFDAPASATTDEPQLQLSPPVQPLEVP